MDLMKKGILLTFLSLLVASFFILIFSARIDVPVDAQADLVSFKITILERFKETWEDYSEKSLNAAAYRSLTQMSEYIDANNVLFFNEPDFKNQFRECMMNGTMRAGTEPCTNLGGASNLTMPFFLDTLSQVALNNLSINITYNITSLDIDQDHPFLVQITMNMSYWILDNYATIEKNVTIQRLVTLEGIREPMMAVRFDPPSSNRFIKATAIKTSEWNKDNLTSFINNKEYRFHRDAPSFLQRMWGDLSGSQCCGIEAVLSESVDSMAPFFGGFLANASYVDHYYFTDFGGAPPSLFDCSEVYEIIGIPNVQIDQERLASFNITTDQWLTIC